MSQFILFTQRKKGNLLPDAVEIQSILAEKHNSLFFQNYATIFWSDDVDKSTIFTISNFDELCINAQRQLVDNIEFEKTLLGQIFHYLQNEEIYCWYSSEIDELDAVTDYGELIIKVTESLCDASGEIYFHYDLT